MYLCLNIEKHRIMQTTTHKGFTPVFRIFKEGTTIGGPVMIFKKDGEEFDIESKKKFYTFLGYTVSKA